MIVTQYIGKHVINGERWNMKHDTSCMQTCAEISDTANTIPACICTHYLVMEILEWTCILTHRPEKSNTHTCMHTPVHSWISAFTLRALSSPADLEPLHSITSAADVPAAYKCISASRCGQFDSFLLRTSDVCVWNHLPIRDADTESTLNCEHSNGLGLDIGNFPQGVGKFTEPFSIVFDKFVTEPEVRLFIKAAICMQNATILYYNICINAQKKTNLLQVNVTPDLN